MTNRTPLSSSFRALMPCALLLAGLFVFLGARPLLAQTPLQHGLPLQPAPTYWIPLIDAAANPPAGGAPLPASYQLWQLDAAQMNTLLASAPAVDVYAPVAAADANAIVVALPLSNGELADFAVFDSPIMEPELAARYPSFRTLAGYAIENPAVTVRLGTTSLGFHATIWGTEATTWIDSLDRGATDRYIVYDAADAISSGGYSEDALDRTLTESQGGANASELSASGDQLYTYRLAISATGKYTQYFGGTVELGMSAIVAAVNRINGIYMRDLAIRLVLVANNNLLVYTNSLADPFTDSDAGALLTENQTLLDAVIGSANYDIGHVFATGSGGLASLGVVCMNSSKARGATGSIAPTGDSFWVDYVAHEIGHQFNADHTFNNNSVGSCAGNRNGPTAWEPGSGSTIMSYAGICGSENLQANSDDYFHSGSIELILAFTRFGVGSNCPLITNTGNTPPVAQVPAGDFTIPYFTPFTLSGGGADANGAASLTYTWEQFDVGPAGSYTSAVGDAPIIRSVLPTTTLASRTIPRMSALVNNTWYQAESLPNTSRTLHFRLSVRDNNPAGGGLDSKPLAVNVTTAAGPFAVTYPDAVLLTWLKGFIYSVKWSVANTDLAPVNCANVEIRLSTDGGLTYPTVLTASTPNDGVADVVAPDIATTLARVQVKCLSNLFFDISNNNFTIDNSPSILQLKASATPPSGAQVQPGDEIQYTFTLINNGLLLLTASLANTFDPRLVGVNCDGTPGNLVANLLLAVTSQIAVDCATQVDPSLALQISHRASQTDVEAGAAITFTIAVTNPTAYAMQEITVTSNHGVACTPALDTPVTLAANSARTYTCAGVIANADKTYQAIAHAKMTLQEQANVSVLALTSGILNSKVVAHDIVFEASQVVSVTAAPVMAIAMTAMPASALVPGNSLTYTVRVTNHRAAPLATTTTSHFAPPLVNPMCDGVAGNLSVIRTIAANSTATYVCATQVDPALALELHISAQRQVAAPGSPVTYTIEVANPNAIPLNQVVVSAPQIQAFCTTNPATPSTLAPQETRRFICPAIADITDVTASATAQVSFTNVAQVASAGVAGSPLSSQNVTSIVNLAASATTEVRNYLTPITR